MSDTITIALISAGSALFGALVGGCAAVFGPLVVGRSERIAVSKASAFETRRSSIVEFIVALLDFAAVFNDPASLGEEGYEARRNRGNDALLDLTSRISASDEAVHSFISNVAGQALLICDRDTQRTFIAEAGTWLVAWHRGVKLKEDLKPFAVSARDANGKYDVVVSRGENWDELRLRVSGQARA